MLYAIAMGQIMTVTYKKKKTQTIKTVNKRTFKYINITLG